MTAQAHVSSYERRLALVEQALSAHSAIKTKDAREVAVRVLEALDRIPEKVR
ncbi:DUF6307 family protein [Actinosynnema pretiosum]|uniref:DUF6307 family protein n=1 Tax=Actinosynnema pretiosum TaxID=42197 RepID=UPI0015A52EB5|nr:DUF6307 family protein [Actinosynnema pretiosum]